MGNPGNKIRLHTAALYALLAGVGAMCVFPLLLVLATSFTEEKSLALHGYRLIPGQLSLDAYNFILNDSTQLVYSYIVTIAVTVCGTIGCLFFTALLAYPISRSEFKYKYPISFYVFFTMLFNGGLVPFYILVTQYLHLKDTLWALIFPYFIQPFFVLMMRTFFASLPDALVESARIEGAGELRIFFQIVVPLSTPVLATVGLFVSLVYWNDWFLALLFIEDRTLLPLQYLLMTLMSNIEVLASNPNGAFGIANIPAESARMAMAVLATGPILFVYGFFQKYFVRGLTIGAVKG